MFQVDERLVEGTRTLRVRGDVDSANAAELRDALRRVQGGQALVVDLRNVPFMDSAGLGALVCGIRELRLKGGTAALCTRRGGVSRLLSVTGFGRIVPTAHSFEEAQESMRNNDRPPADSKAS